jgi:hypothetical protein
MSESLEGASQAGPLFPLQPTPIHVSDEQISDLRTRLQHTRWALGVGNDDWYYGVGRTYLEELVDYWLGAYDWHKAETAINRYDHYQVSVDGVPIHFMRKPGIGRYSYKAIQRIKKTLEVEDIDTIWPTHGQSNWKNPQKHQKKIS